MSAPAATSAAMNRSKRYVRVTHAQESLNVSLSAICWPRGPASRFANGSRKSAPGRSVSRARYAAAHIAVFGEEALFGIEILEEPIDPIGPDNPLYAPTLLNSINDNRVDSRFYVNLFGSVFIDAAKRFEVFGSVSNLFNTDPPAAPETQFYTNPVYFDTLGRYFRVGARVKL